jgi:hypothetical protein
MACLIGQWATWQTTGWLVDERSGLSRVLSRLLPQGLNRWQLATITGREANVDNDHVCRAPVTPLTTYLFRIL